MTVSRSITLVIPGLLDNLPDPVPRLPALEILLARADCRNDLPVGYERTLMHLFGLPQSPDRDVPEGALGRYAQTGEKPEGIWLCAAPVHLFADQSRVYLNTIDEAALSENEASQLIAELNKVYRDDGWEFVQHSSTRWYLRIPDEPGIRTTPLREVDGKTIHDKLPQGEDALQWHRVLNEMQMLLHSSVVNQARLERGEIAVNGVWLWGSGILPESGSATQWQTLFADEIMTQGLALCHEISSGELPVTAVQCVSEMREGENIVVMMPFIEKDTGNTLQRLEDDWFAPLLAALKGDIIKKLVILFADGRQWKVCHRNLWFFWRRRESLHKYKKNS